MSKNNCLNVVIFHHNDLDGYGAAAVVQIGIGEKAIDMECDCYATKYYECNYNNLKVTAARVKEYIDSDEGAGTPVDEVYIVDLSFSDTESFEEVYKILDENPSCRVTWIDHHEASAKILDTLQKDPRFYQYVNSGRLLYIVSQERSGVWLTYVHFFKDEVKPRSIILIDDYDRWVHAHTDSKFLNNAFWMSKPNYELKCPFSEEWEKLLMIDDEDEEILNTYLMKGKVIAEYRKGLNEGVFKSYAYTVEDFEGHKAVVLNSTGNSECFGEAYNEYPLCILWRFNGSKYSYSLYSKPSFGVNCNEIANKYGGGGHAGAAGFTTDELLPALKQGIRASKV